MKPDEQQKLERIYNDPRLAAVHRLAAERLLRERYWRCSGCGETPCRPDSRGLCPNSPNRFEEAAL